MTDEPLVGDAGHEARARAHGFTIDAYHGSRTPLRGEGFDPALIGSHTGAHVTGFHFASDPRHAADYARKGFGDNYEGGYIVPVRLRLQNPFRVYATMRGRTVGLPGCGSVTLLEHDDAARAAIALGHDGVILTGWASVRYGVYEDEQYIVFDPAQIRSRFACWDSGKEEVGSLRPVLPSGGDSRSGH
jgi:ADP-Ribosyltransferase in polyvalent proteins